MKPHVDETTIDLISRILTEDPNINIKRIPIHRNEGKYFSDDVELDQNGTMGTVEYRYELIIDGQWVKTSWDSEGSDPEIHIGKITNMDIKGYDEYGRPITPSPELLKIWQSYAINHFRQIKNIIEDEEYEKLSEGEYDRVPEFD